MATANPQQTLGEQYPSDMRDAYLELIHSKQSELAHHQAQVLLLQVEIEHASEVVKNCNMLIRCEASRREVAA